jgi:tetrahydromethanopterin S-methyltransferase subunit B
MAYTLETLGQSFEDYKENTETYRRTREDSDRETARKLETANASLIKKLDDTNDKIMNELKALTAALSSLPCDAREATTIQVRANIDKDSQKQWRVIGGIISFLTAMVIVIVTAWANKRL